MKKKYCILIFIHLISISIIFALLNIDYFNKYYDTAFVILIILGCLIVWNLNLKECVRENVFKFKKSERRQEYILENLKVGIVVYDMNGNMTHNNAEYKKIFSHKNSYFVNINGEKLKPEEFPFYKVINENIPVYDYTIGIKKMDIEDIAWIRVDALPDYDEKNQLESVIISFVDITDRINIEKALCTSESKLRAILKAIPDLFFVIDFNGAFVDFVSEHNSKKLLLKKEDFIGKTVADVLPKHISVGFKSSMDNLIKTGEIQILEYSLPIEGDVLFFEARIVLCGEDRILAMTRDITERKQSERLMYEISMKDSLSGAYNRNYFEKQLAIKEANCSKNLAVVSCDLDGLKLINDTLGHESGDKYIKNVAKILFECFRDKDIISRTGGDEFTILLEDITLEEIEEIKRDIINKIQLCNVNEDVFCMSVSIGYSVMKENESLRDMLKEADEYMYREKLHHHQSSRSKNIDLLTRMLKERDFITEGHGERLVDLVTKLSRAIGYDEYEIRNMSLFAQFHDIGKVGIPDYILFKPEGLSVEERSVIKKHSEIGFRIAKASPDLLYIADWIFKHHEMWDGKGYPLGLKEEDIPMQCRILAIADAYDAMVSDRPYRSAMSKDEALSEIKKNRGTQFDPYLVDVFIKIFS